MEKDNRFLLYYLTSFVTGYAALSLELLGFRLLAPYFGYSLYVSGALIGIILLALSLGYFLGGLASDRWANEGLVPKVLLAISIYLLFVKYYHTALLQSFFEFSVIGGSLLSTIVLFGLPMTLLASLSPYFIKILSMDRGRQVGISAGSIYSIGTVGSLVGTFFTSFYLVPEFGAEEALTLNISVLIAVCAFWFAKKNKLAALMCIAVAILIFFIPRNESAAKAGALVQIDSAYSMLEVVDYGVFLGLRTDRRNDLVYSVYPKQGKWPPMESFYHLFAIPPILNDAKKSLLLGLGAGTIPLIHSQQNPRLAITGVEIDSKIPELGREYFGLQDLTNTKIIIADARPFLMKNSEHYDFIEADLFTGSGEIPFYLATREFFSLAESRLAAHGIFAMNIYDPSPDKKIARPIQNTASSVFPYAYSVSFGDHGSYFLIGSKDPITEELLSERLPKNTSDQAFAATIAVFKNKLTQEYFSPKRPTFTDNHAPLEKLSYETVFKQKK